MAKIRIIPFGYCMKSGEITVDFTEAKAVMRIFEEYMNGSSLLQISAEEKAISVERENRRSRSVLRLWRKSSQLWKAVIHNECAIYILPFL